MAPGVAFLVGQRIEERLGDPETAAQRAELAPGDLALKRHEAGVGLASLREDELLAGPDAVQQTREVRLGLVDVDGR